VDSFTKWDTVDHNVVESVSDAFGGGTGLAATIQDTAQVVGDFTRGVGLLIDEVVTLTQTVNDATSGFVDFGRLARTALATGTRGFRRLRLIKLGTVRHGPCRGMRRNAEPTYVHDACHGTRSIRFQRSMPTKFLMSRQNPLCESSWRIPARPADNPRIRTTRNTTS